MIDFWYWVLLSGVGLLYLILFLIITGPPPERHPAGKYQTVGGLWNMKGESKEELFARQDRVTTERIRAGRPSMPMEDYMAISTDKTACYYRMGDPSDGTGAVLERAENGNWTLTLYNLNKAKV
jgi:hypothetical protein